MHDHHPDNATAIRLHQQATLATRPDKPARSLADLTADWRARAHQLLGNDAQPWASCIATAAKPRQEVRVQVARSAPNVGGYAEEVLERLLEERSTWRRWNVHAEAARVTTPLRVARRRGMR